jgi:hypothetical protein
MDYPQASEAHYNTQAGIGAAAVLLARRTWASLRISDDFDAVWQSLGAKLLLILAAAQQSAVIDGAAYVGSVLDEFGVAADPVAAVVGSTVKARIVPSSLVGVASSGRPLESLLYNSIIDVKQALGAGASPVVALQKGQFTVETIVQTQVADAGRSATSVAMAIRPKVTRYVRMLRRPSCPRCVVLAGKEFPWNAGFSRHPKCDCVGIPITENVKGDFSTDPVEAVKAGAVRGLSVADTKAIVEDGANVSRVINAHSGMDTAQVFGRDLKITFAKTSRRKATDLRLRPESIYQIAASRSEAISLLKKYGYIT